MSKSTSVIIVLVLIVLAVIYLKVIRMDLTKAYQVLGEKQFGGMDQDYLIARARAQKKSEATFTIAGKTYTTESGKAA